MDESQCIVSDLINELNALVIRCMVDAALKDTTAMTMSSNFNTVCSYGIIDELKVLLTTMQVFRLQRTNLIVLRSQLVETLLDNMIAVQVLDKHYNMKAECNNDRMNLSIVSMISLNPIPRKCARLNNNGTTLACLRVDKKSIIF